MADFDGAGGRLEFRDRDSLRQWLGTQPREVCVVIAARAALRALPLFVRVGEKADARRFSQCMLGVFWSTALARVAAAYPTRANDLRAHAAYAAAATAYVATAAATTASDVAYAAANAADVYYAPDAAANAANAADAAAASDEAIIFWKALSQDANALGARYSVSALARESLWSGGPPASLKLSWARLQTELSDPHWRPWLDWYQRRLDGRELSEDIELLFATLPDDPDDKSPDEQNALLAAEIARLTPKRKARSEWDYFVSFAEEDKAIAEEVVAVLNSAGHSAFVQFDDIPQGSNFIREIQRGLDGSKRLVALLSPDYEASDHCQSEWASAYNRDPSGRKGVLVPFKVRETKLNGLAEQVVYVSLVGMSAEQRKAAILAAIARQPLPTPVEKVVSPFAFEWSASYRVTIAAGPQNTPVFQHLGSDRDHKQRLDACRKTATRLVEDLSERSHNVPSRFLNTINRYLEDLPAAPGDGNFLLADGQARTLRGLFEEDADMLPREVAEQLLRILEYNTALRAYYEGVGRFYSDVKSGQLSQPLPKDAVDEFVRTVQAHTPDLFEESVSEGLERVEQEPPVFEHHAPSPDHQPTLTPPPDPLGEIDPQKSHAYGVAGSINELYKAFLKGKDFSQAVKGWDEAAEKLGESAGPVIDWLKNFLPQ